MITISLYKHCILMMKCTRSLTVSKLMRWNDKVQLTYTKAGKCPPRMLLNLNKLHWSDEKMLLGGTHTYTGEKSPKNWLGKESALLSQTYCAHQSPYQQQQPNRIQEAHVEVQRGEEEKLHTTVFYGKTQHLNRQAADCDEVLAISRRLIVTRHHRSVARRAC